MDTKLIGITDNCNIIAKNIFEGSIKDLISSVKDIVKNPPETIAGLIEAAVKFHIGRAPLPHLQDIKEPVFNKEYLLNFYIDNALHSSFIVRFIGMTEGLKWFAFQYVFGNTIDGQERHLLSVTDSDFPNYKAEPYPGTIISEQYILID